MSILILIFEDIQVVCAIREEALNWAAGTSLLSDVDAGENSRLPESLEDFRTWAAAADLSIEDLFEAYSYQADWDAACRVSTGSSVLKRLRDRYISTPHSPARSSSSAREGGPARTPKTSGRRPSRPSLASNKRSRSQDGQEAFLFLLESPSFTLRKGSESMSSSVSEADSSCSVSSTAENVSPVLSCML